MTENPVDAHCHLDFDSYDEDREKVVSKCREELDFVVNSGRDPESNAASLELQKNYSKFIVATAGIHPTHTDSFNSVGKVKRQIREKDFHAVGEIGMDFHHVEDEDLREKQKQVFVQMVEFAEEMDLPVVAHSRNAEKQVVDVLSERSTEAYLHCFNGNMNQLEKSIENDIFIGVTYQAEYSNRVQEIVRRCPLELMLLETDSPFLYKSERNSPMTVLQVAEKIAEIKDVEVEEVIAKTTDNARELFGTAAE